MPPSREALSIKNNAERIITNWSHHWYLSVVRVRIGGTMGAGT